MENDRLGDLERRVAALEAELESWRVRTREILGQKTGRTTGRTTGGGRAGTSAATDSLRRLAELVTGEGAIGRIGIGLVLLGLVFGVKYGIDRGWITEMVQVGIAVVLGLVLLGLGYRIREKRPILGRLLTGGGFGSLYVAVFSAQAVYGLVPVWPALALASLVTVACLMVGTSRDDAAMGIVAVLGGLVTPFIIRTGDTDLPALVAYVSVVLAAAGLLYWRHGWRSLLLWTALSATPVIILILVYLNEPDLIPLSWRWSAQAGLVVFFALFAGAPLARSAIAGPRPAPSAPDWIPPELARFALPVLAVVLGLASWFMERAVWNLESVSWAAIGFGFTLWLAVAWDALHRARERDGSGALLILGLVVAAFIFVDLFDADGLSLAGWTGVLFFASVAETRYDRAGGWIAAAVLAAVVVFWLPEQLAGRPGDSVPLLNWDSAGEILALLFLGLTARQIPHSTGRLIAGLAVWIATLWFFAGEFPEAWAVTTAWSVFAVALLASGRIAPVFRIVGMATVALVVAKLLLFDLSRLDELVRVGLFAGFGLVLLFVSYFFPSWWRASTEANSAED